MRRRLRVFEKKIYIDMNDNVNEGFPRKRNCGIDFMECLSAVRK